MKLWLCGDHHTGTTYFYNTFLKLANATNERYFSTTAFKEFIPNHYCVAPKFIPKMNPTNNYDNSSPLKYNHDCFIKTASNYHGGTQEGWQRLNNMFSCYSRINLLISEPTNFTLGMQNASLYTTYNNLLDKHDILMIFIIRNPVELECSRWSRKLMRFMKNKESNQTEKLPTDNMLKNYLTNLGYLDKIEQKLKSDGEFEVDYFPSIASTRTRDTAKPVDSSYYQYYSNLISWAKNCKNIRITTYENLFADIKYSTRKIVKYLSESGLENDKLSLQIDKLNTARINSSNKQLTFSNRVKEKMRTIHREGFQAWSDASQLKDKSIIF